MQTDLSLHITSLQYWVQTNQKQEQALNANWSHIPFPDDGHRFRRVAGEDHVVALGQDEPLGADVHPVVHRGLRLAQVDPGQVMELVVGNSSSPIGCVSFQRSPALVNSRIFLLSKDQRQSAALQHGFEVLRESKREENDKTISQLYHSFVVIAP